MMSFGLENAGATYQSIATALLRDMMHNKVEVYMENKKVKSRDKECHIVNWRKFLGSRNTSLG